MSYLFSVRLLVCPADCGVSSDLAFAGSASTFCAITFPRNVRYCRDNASRCLCTISAAFAASQVVWRSLCSHHPFQRANRIARTTARCDCIPSLWHSRREVTLCLFCLCCACLHVWLCMHTQLLLLALVTLEMCSAAAAWRADSLIRPVRSILIPLRGGGPKSAADKKGGDKKPDDKKVWCMRVYVRLCIESLWEHASLCIFHVFNMQTSFWGIWDMWFCSETLCNLPELKCLHACVSRRASLRQSLRQSLRPRRVVPRRVKRSKNIIVCSDNTSSNTNMQDTVVLPPLLPCPPSQMHTHTHTHIRHIALS